MQLRWYFDFVSPFSYLHWHKLQAMPQFAQIEPVPIVFGAVLQERGIRGPAEIPHKRLFTYRQALWQARCDGVALRFPPAHPFNPLAALRLCIAAGTTPEAITAIFDHLWRDGRAGNTSTELQTVASALGIDDIDAAIDDAPVKAQLRANTEAALVAGVFGVPTLAIDDALFWGNDMHTLMQAVLADPALLRTGEMARLATLPEGVRRDA